METRIIAKPARRCHDIVVRHRSGDEETLGTATVSKGYVTLDNELVVGKSGNRAAGIVIFVKAADAKDVEVAISGLLALRDVLTKEAAPGRKALDK